MRVTTMTLLAGVSMPMLLALAPTATGQGVATTYSVTELGNFTPTGVNRSRWVTGYTSEGVLWRPGIGLTDRTFCPGPGACSNRLTGINDFGWHSGWIWSGNAYRAVRYEGVGGLADLPVFMGDIEGGGDYSRADAINNRGGIAGQGSGQYQSHPVYGNLSYNHAGRSYVPGGPMQDLGGSGAVGALFSIGYGNNDCNAVAGAANGPNGSTAAYWPAFSALPSGSFNDLGLAWGVQRSGAQSYAWDVNNRNQVALELPLVAANETTAAIWSPYFSFTEIGRLPGRTTASARAINDAGLVVGFSGFRAFAWTDQDGIVDLTTRLDPVLGAGGWTILRANGVSENGHIVGLGTRPGVPSSGVAVLLSPVQCAGFLDVPASSPFCASVEWMKARSITLGCNAGNYCPDSSVVRLAMAAFMQRLGEWMSGQAIVESDAPGALDFADAPVVCSTGDIVSATAPRHAVVDAILSGRASDNSTGYTRLVVSQDRGVSWQALSTHDPQATFPSGEWRSVRGVAHYDMPAYHELRFGVRVDRGTSTDPAAVNDSACRLRVRIGNGFDPGL